MSKPVKLPRWATNPTSPPPGQAIVEPAESKKDQGWIPFESPDFNLVNWLDNLNYQWLEWIERATSTTTKALANWQYKNRPILTNQHISSVGGGLVMIGGKHDFGSGWESGAAVSIDGGHTWAISSPFGLGAGNIPAYQAAWNGSNWAIGGMNGNLATSPDGMVWTARTSGLFGTIGNLIWDSTIGLYVGSDGSNIITSPTGATWTLQTSSVGGYLATNGAGLLTCWKASSGNIWTSTDAINWTLQTANFPTLSAPVGLSYSGGYFWIANQNPVATPNLYKSIDGVTWTQITNLPSNISALSEISATPHSAGQKGILVVGGFANTGPEGSGGLNPVIMYSIDAGETWFVNYYHNSLVFGVGGSNASFFSAAFVGDYDHFLIALSQGIYISSIIPIDNLL